MREKEQQEDRSLSSTDVRYRTTDVDGMKIFYREVGAPSAPSLLLLHGFPTASHMFRELISLLADRFHFVAPDLPGFGRSDMPSRESFSYTFDNLARTIDRFTDVIGLFQFAMYIFDYGAPVGFRIACNRPERVKAIISQNAYEEGLSTGWNSFREYWRKPTPEAREALRSAFTPETTLYQYTQGVVDRSLVSPDGPSLDDYYLARQQAQDVQLDLFLDYATNVALYPKFQAYFRENNPPLLAVWGRNDPYFLPAGAKAFKRDIPNAEIHLLDTGHFALETHCTEIATIISAFFKRKFRSEWPGTDGDLDSASSKSGEHVCVYCY
jgi:pimeloyl-ACP methyl ester carboxylesterase